LSFKLIPKIIHYCWFGKNPLPPLAVDCINSWKKHCPDYVIKQWNESNFDINLTPYTKEAYEAKKWAFVSDVARLYAIYTDGGIYFDTDVEVIKPLDAFLNTNMFIGFESHKHLATGLCFGAEKNFYLTKKMLDAYNDLPFLMPNGKLNTTPCTVYNTIALKEEGFMINNTKQTINNITVYPTEFFCPKDVKTGILTITKNTHCIHHYDASWLSDTQKKEHKILSKYRKKHGTFLGEFLFIIMAFLTFRRSGIKYVIEKIRSAIA